MRTIRYVGPHADGVEVPDLDREVPRDVPIEVDDALAVGLLQQETNWVEDKSTAPKKGDK